MDVSLAWQSRTTPEINSTGHVVGKLAWSMTSRCCQEVRCLNPMCLVLHSAKYFNMFFSTRKPQPRQHLFGQHCLKRYHLLQGRIQCLISEGRLQMSRNANKCLGLCARIYFFNAHKGVQALNPQSDIQKLLVGKFNLHISLLCFCARLSGVGIQIVRWQEA